MIEQFAIHLWNWIFHQKVLLVSNADEISINIEQDDSSIFCNSSLKAHALLPTSILKALGMKLETIQ